MPLNLRPRQAFDAIVGRQLVRAVGLLADHEGRHLYKSLQAAAERVSRSGDGSRALLDHAADEFGRWWATARHTHPPEAQAIIDRHLADYLATGRRAAIKLIAQETARNKEAEEFLFGVIRDHMRALSRSSAALDRAVSKQFEHFMAQLGDEAEAWGRVLHVLSVHAGKISKEARDLEPLIQKLRTLPDGEPFRKLQRQILNKKSSMRWQVRGKLGEVYVSSWRRWRQELDHLEMEAEHIAMSLSPQGAWKVHRFTEVVKLDNKEVWDECILLVNEAEGRVKLHTALQVKVERGRRVKSLDQIPQDSKREAAASTLTIEGKKYNLDEAGDAFEVRRYALFAEEGLPAAKQIKALEQARIPVKAIGMDVTSTGFDLVTLEFMRIVHMIVKESIG
ncbi:MAG: hypothetical protein IT363_08400 [Methanoregulaceae archaeon]|nr:hypothetical protein [Methanoregulaceae archaeon]